VPCALVCAHMRACVRMRSVCVVCVLCVVCCVCSVCVVCVCVCVHVVGLVISEDHLYG